MGLKGYRLWVMGQLDSNVQSPTGVHCKRSAVCPSLAKTLVQRPRRSGTQINPFESKGLTPVFHFIGARVETRRLQSSYGSTEFKEFSCLLC
jgi:hypothetical protein